MRGISLIAFQCSKGFDYTTDADRVHTKNIQRNKNRFFLKLTDQLSVAVRRIRPTFGERRRRGLGIKRHAIGCSGVAP
jgi:hypothetical protein